MNYNTNKTIVNTNHGQIRPWCYCFTSKVLLKNSKEKNEEKNASSHKVGLIGRAVFLRLFPSFASPLRSSHNGIIHSLV